MITTIKPIIKSPLDDFSQNKSEDIKCKVKKEWSKKTDNTDISYSYINNNIELEKTNPIDLINKFKYVNINNLPTNKNISADYNRYNFLLLYKKISNLSVTEKEAFISEMIKSLNKNNAFQHQESLKKAVEVALNKVTMVNLALEPLTTQMHHNIANLTIEYNDDEEELIFS
ncbi:hypothetical protein [Providencia sneebia]|uniref:Uncharacterized protein n=1 Tax=Providencia sneebia DSM 19967 TaxID=1141660 RepID=K8WJW5_9GAMM|nr:hypothetical protein [Providencia sneebia]EKT60878.1 hypothetical protein OO7_02266 [Providencia sneebia DSM 19967]